MNSLSAKIAALLGAVFMLVGFLVVVATQIEPALLSVPAVLGVIGLALAAAWCLLQPTARRIGQLADAVESFQRGGFAAPLRLPGADAGGDEIARLAAQAERVSEHVASQASTLAHAARQRGELLANVSHDLRTPLASMQGYLELLLLRQGSLDPAQVHDYLQTAVRQSERLARLVGDLFELTRLEADDMRLQSEAFALAELAQDVVQKFALDARRRKVSLATRCDAALDAAGAMMVQADIALVERVLENLVENALRHTPAGGVVTIAIARHERHAQMAVCDTGEGIAAEDLPGIFERYDRASRVGTAGSGVHAGLGLAIARRIVNLHGSQLQVQSAPGQGTRVSFDLALADLRAAVAAVARDSGLAA
jgi:signal transduction histidine kinase